jgi:Holliday junction resolvase RusA-like endonuclease
MIDKDTEIEKLFIWTNPDFNEAFVFYGLEAISFRDRDRAKQLSQTLKTQLTRIQCDNWPYRNPVMIVIEINGPTKMYSRRDVDNMSKVILDSCNKIVYVDDRLINILIVEKRIWDQPLYGFHLGIRVLENDKKDKYSPQVCFASKAEPDIDKSKIMKPVLFRFENEADKEHVRQHSK